MKAKEQRALQWHPAFFAGIQIELEEEKEYLTFVTSGYPHKVIQHLETVLHIQMKRQENGIYYGSGAFFPIQFLVTSKLTDEMNFWLHHLTNRLKDSDEARKLLHRYEAYQDSNLHKSVMDIIVRANQEMFRGDEKMCDALMEIVQEKIEEKLEESKNLGKNEKLQELICKKLQKGKSVEQIAEELEESVESISKMIETMQNA